MASKLNFNQKLEILPPKVKIDSNDKKAAKAARAAMAAGMVKATTYVSRDLAMALDAAMAGSNWSWPGSTLRKSGETAGRRRDIIDMGRLYESQQIKEKFLQTKSTIEIIYNTPYAALVHYGGAIQPYGNQNAPTVVVPGRPWITSTLQGGNGINKFDMRTPMQKGFLEEWNKRIG